MGAHAHLRDAAEALAPTHLRVGCLAAPPEAGRVEGTACNWQLHSNCSEAGAEDVRGTQEDLRTHYSKMKGLPVLSISSFSPLIPS